MSDPVEATPKQPSILPDPTWIGEIIAHTKPDSTYQLEYRLTSAESAQARREGSEASASLTVWVGSTALPITVVREFHRPEVAANNKAMILNTLDAFTAAVRADLDRLCPPELPIPAPAPATTPVRVSMASAPVADELPAKTSSDWDVTKALDILESTCKQSTGLEFSYTSAHAAEIGGRGREAECSLIAYNALTGEREVMCIREHQPAREKELVKVRMRGTLRCWANAVLTQASKLSGLPPLSVDKDMKIEATPTNPLGLIALDECAGDPAARDESDVAHIGIRLSRAFYNTRINYSSEPGNHEQVLYSMVAIVGVERSLPLVIRDYFPNGLKLETQHRLWTALHDWVKAVRATIDRM